MRTKKLIFISFGLVILVPALVLLMSRGPGTPPVRITFIGFTNSAAGTQFARFEIRNEMKRRIVRNGYCKVNSDVVDIQSSTTLLPGQSEKLEVPVTSRSGTSLPLADLRVVRFNGVRDLPLGEEVIVICGELLQKVGIGSGRLEVLADRNRWEVPYEFDAIKP